MASLEIKQRMKSLLLFLPQLLALCGRLMVDQRVPRTEKALLLGAIIYAIVPFDFIPDFLPFVGQIDDIYLISLTLLRLISRTDETVVRQHWRGGGDLAKLAASVAAIAPLLLPQRVRRVLTSKVEVAPQDESILSGRKKGKREATLIEISSNQ
jgi:uncharacterized membrane protein YkvA (DUF1232 family)